MSDQRKPRSPARFREREVTRITKAVRVAGGGTVTLDPVTGNFTIVVAGEDEAPRDTTDNSWDEVYAAHEKRPA
jgi:lipoate-protein ligase A